jgi:phospholipid/cholesterol/gamma-HCH transport system permease protein
MIRLLAQPFFLVADLAYKAGRGFFDVFAGLSELYYLIGRVARELPSLARRFRFTADQMMSLGVGSLPLVAITSCFTGGVAASQASYQFSNIVPLTYLGTAVCKAVVIELGPVLTALVLAGRIGASIAAELGSMKTNEQIDAMECLALNPILYLVLPRLVAGMIMFLVLTIIADFIAILGAWLVSVCFLNISSNLFLAGLRLFFSPGDVFAGLLKAAIFGGIITLMGCYNGVRAEGGAEGVGKATMNAVVSSCVLVLIFDFVVAALIF